MIIRKETKKNPKKNKYKKYKKQKTLIYDNQFVRTPLEN